jgi:hypothetical protein
MTADPWLGHRRADAAEVDSAVQATQDAVWEVLPAWLGSVSRSVLATGRPDPNGVFTHNPMWMDAVKSIAAGPLATAIGRPYRELLGDRYDYLRRPAVAEHLAVDGQVLDRFPDEVHGAVSAAISAGAAAGSTTAAISAQVEEILAAGPSSRWNSRIATVARSLASVAVNAGRCDAYTVVAELLAQPFEKMWLAAGDPRTRDSHRQADTQRVKVDGQFSVGTASLRYPRDPLGPTGETSGCRCTTLLTVPGSTEDFTHVRMFD